MLHDIHEHQLFNAKNMVIKIKMSQFQGICKKGGVRISLLTDTVLLICSGLPRQKSTVDATYKLLIFANISARR